MPGTIPRAEERTLANTVDRLTRAGYTDWFKADAGGLRASAAGCIHPPGALGVDEVVRFEGDTDPDDESIVFALVCKEHGVKGTYTVPYGTQIPPADAAIVRHLHTEAAKRN